MRSAASAPPYGRPLAAGPVPDDRYTNVGRLEDRVIVQQNSAIVFS